MYKTRAEELLDNIQTNIECPPATQDISLNLANRKTPLTDNSGEQ